MTITQPDTTPNCVRHVDNLDRDVINDNRMEDQQRIAALEEAVGQTLASLDAIAAELHTRHRCLDGTLSPGDTIILAHVNNERDRLIEVLAS